MANGITINQLNEALSRQTVMILDRVDEMIDEKLETKLEEKLDAKFEEFATMLTEDFSNQLIDLMTHIDKRFDTLEKILTATVVRVDDHEGRITTLEHYGRVNSTSSPI